MNKPQLWSICDAGAKHMASIFPDMPTRRQPFHSHTHTKLSLSLKPCAREALFKGGQNSWLAGGADCQLVHVHGNDNRLVRYLRSYARQLQVAEFSKFSSLWYVLVLLPKTCAISNEDLLSTSFYITFFPLETWDLRLDWKRERGIECKTRSSSVFLYLINPPGTRFCIGSNSTDQYLLSKSISMRIEWGKSEFGFKSYVPSPND